MRPSGLLKERFSLSVRNYIRSPMIFPLHSRVCCAYVGINCVCGRAGLMKTRRRIRKKVERDGEVEGAGERVAGSAST